MKWKLIAAFAATVIAAGPLSAGIYLGGAATPPELAKAAAATYGGGYASPGCTVTPYTFEGGLRADVQICANGAAVIAFRGTDPDHLLANSLADSGFVANSPVMAAYLAQAAALVRQVADAHPGSAITLTGYSLGGGIAQVVGQAAGLNAVGFDAPGGLAALSIYDGSLTAVRHLGPGGTSINYRLNGDPVSASGAQIGTLVTVIPTGEAIATESRLADHAVEPLVAALGSGQYTTSTTIIPAPLGFVDNVIDAGSSIFTGTAVGLMTHYYLDPVGASSFKLVGDVGSPLFASVTFEDQVGIASYSFNWCRSGLCSNGITIAPLTEYDFVGGADRINFTALDGQGNAYVVPYEFGVDVSFQSAGDFRGRVDPVERQGSGVPEPSTWAMLILGFGSIGYAGRRGQKRRGLVPFGLG